MLDSVDFVATFLGAIALGAIPVPLNTLLTADDYAYLVRDMRAAALIASDALLPKLAAAASAVRAVAGCETALGGDLGKLPSWRALIDQAAPLPAFAATTPDDGAF